METYKITKIGDKVQHVDDGAIGTIVDMRNSKSMPGTIEYRVTWEDNNPDDWYTIRWIKFL